MEWKRDDYPVYACWWKGSEHCSKECYDSGNCQWYAEHKKPYENKVLKR